MERVKLLCASFSAASLTATLILVLNGRLLEGSATSIGAALPLALLLISKRASRRIDSSLLTAVVHMYALSLGNVSSLELVKAVAETREYGLYSRLFSAVRELVLGLGYGLSEALAHVASTAKSPVKDILVRLTEAFSTTEPSGFLELEFSTTMEEFSGLYTRVIDVLKLMGGMLSTFQSISMFIVLVVSIMTMFFSEPSVIPVSYIVASASILVMLIALKAVVPRERIVHAGKETKPYRTFKLSLILLPVSAIAALAVHLRIGYGLALLTAGAILTVPGLIAYRLEAKVLKIDEYYPAFLKALGENLASTSSLKSALKYVVDTELGPLKRLVENTISWLSLGLSYEKALRFMAYSSNSHMVHIFNRILADSVRNGSNPLKVGMILSNTTIRLLEFRKRRFSTGRSVETAILILQPITVCLLVVLTHISELFSNLLTPHSSMLLPLTPIPIDLITLGNMILVPILTVVNSMTIVEVKGGFRGTALTHVAVLLLVSGVSWIAADWFMSQAFSGIELTPTLP